jgi:hypothetical protein
MSDDKARERPLIIHDGLPIEGSQENSNTNENVRKALEIVNQVKGKPEGKKG